MSSESESSFYLLFILAVEKCEWEIGISFNFDSCRKSAYKQTVFSEMVEPSWESVCSNRENESINWLQRSRNVIAFWMDNWRHTRRNPSRRSTSPHSWLHSTHTSCTCAASCCTRAPSTVRDPGPDADPDPDEAPCSQREMIVSAVRRMYSAVGARVAHSSLKCSCFSTRALTVPSSPIKEHSCVCSATASPSGDGGLGGS